MACGHDYCLIIRNQSINRKAKHMAIESLESELQVERGGPLSPMQ